VVAQFQQNIPRRPGYTLTLVGLDFSALIRRRVNLSGRITSFAVAVFFTWPQRSGVKDI
jgi:hypothetical protein